MKKLIKDPGYLLKVFMLFIVAMTLLSIFGGYQLSKLIYKMNDFTLQQTDHLLLIDENLDDAAIVLGRQVQEWKDMLLRSDDEELYNKHRKAFLNSSVEVQEALLRTKTAMQRDGLDTKEIEQLSIEHKALLSYYILAETRLNPKSIDSSHEVDRQVIGIDRNLQQHIAAVKSDIAQLANQQLNGTIYKQGNRYLVVGLLGTISLLVMAILGFVFAGLFQNTDSETAANSSAI